MGKRESEYELVEDPSQATILALVQALKSLKGDDDETLRKRAEYEAEAHRRLTRRENETHPGVSAFNPKGERDNPKPDLKCRMSWVGFPLDKEGLTPAEVDLLNRVDTVGVFSFTRTDGSTDQIEVRGERNADGQWAKLEFLFACRGDKRHNLPSMVSMLRDVLGMESLEVALQKRVAELEALVA